MKKTPKLFSSHISKSGFTLLELSIVLTIIALIISAILVGQSLYRTSQIRAAITEAQRYAQATSAFRDKYLALPGDFSGATALWGAAPSCPSNTNGSGTQTCDGNGDGRIVDFSSSSSWSSTSYEWYTAWQHLANAGLIEGNYTNTYNIQAGPSCQLSGAGWVMFTLIPSDFGGDTTIGVPYQTGDAPPGTVIALAGLKSAPAAQLHFASILLATEAQDIDQKIDDGYPTTGKTVSSSYNANGATTCYTSSNGVFIYDNTTSDAVCALIFKTGL